MKIIGVGADEEFLPRSREVAKAAKERKEMN